MPLEVINHGGGRHDGFAIGHLGAQHPAAATVVRRRPAPFVVVVFWLAGSIMLGVVALLAVAAVVPVPLELIRGDIERRIDRHIDPLRISVGQVDGRALVRGPSLVLSADQVTLAGPTGARVAFLPAGSVVLPVGPLLGGSPAVSEMTLVRPSFEVTRGRHGAIGISLGAFDRPLGDDAVLPLASIASIGEPIDCCREMTIRRLRVEDGALTLRDEASGARLLFDRISLDYDAAAPNVPLRLSASQTVGDHGLRFEAAIHRPARDGTLAIHIRPDAVYPAVLGDAVPGGGFLGPFEMPVSGDIVLVLYRDQSLATISFDLHAGAGSLEVAEYNSDNIAVKSMTLRGRLDRRANVLTIEESIVRLAGGRALFAGSARAIGEDFEISLTADLFGLDLATILPGWFGGLRAALNVGAAMSTADVRIRLSLDGIVQAENGTIAAQGSVAVTMGEPADVPFRFVAFDLGGDLMAPQLVVDTSGR